MADRKKILVVDDQAYIRILLEQTLEELEEQGVELLSAGDGEEGLSLALQEHPDLVFLDLMMPRMNGYQVCEQIKAHDAQIHVILLTSKGQAIDKERGRAAGADEYITKPFDPDEIIARAEEVLGL